MEDAIYMEMFTITIFYLLLEHCYKLELTQLFTHTLLKCFRKSVISRRYRFISLN